MAMGLSFTALVYLLVWFPQILHGSTHCFTPPCQQGCWLVRGTNTCGDCHDCTQHGLMDRHPRECRGLGFPRYCQLEGGEDIATAIPTVQLPDNVQGNFSQIKGKWVVFFYPEEAEESPGTIVSRVGKVCAHEWQKNSTQWVTFQKARLVCTSEDNVQYNYLEHIISVTKAVGSKISSYYYGVFSKSRLNSEKSAICVYSSRSVSQAMRGEFSDPVSERDGVGHTAPVPDQYMPDGWTPGQCNGANLTDWQTTFIRTHPLMFEKVEKELLHKGLGHFTRLASDTQVGLNNKTYIVLFIGTDDGKLFKFVELQNGNSNILEEILLTPVADKITDLKIIQTEEGKKVRALSATSDEPLTVPVQRCVNMSACACPQDPYCVWNSEDHVCEKFSVRGGRFNQSVDEKQDCSRNSTHPALLVTSYRVPPTTVEPVTAKEKLTVDPKKSISQDEGGGGFEMLVLPILLSILFIAVIVFTILVAWKLVKRREKQGCCGNALQVIPTWTSITLKSTLFISHNDNWRLKDRSVQPRFVKGLMGKAKKLIFEGLTPRTSYVIMKGSDCVKEVTTDGPKLEIADGLITKTSISVNILKWNEDFNGKIRLVSDVHSREKVIMTPSYMQIDGLLPNVEYTIFIDVTNGEHQTISTMQFQKVKTKEAEFQIDSNGGTCIVRWNELPNQISELNISTCCAPSDVITVNAAKRYAEMKRLCEVEDLMIKVQGKVNSIEYEMASLRYNARLSGACSALPCISQMKDVMGTAAMKFRKDLSILVVRSELVYLKYCETLEYSVAEASAFFKLDRTPENRFSLPVSDRNEDANMDKFVKTFVMKYEDLFNSKASNERDIKECFYIFSVIEKLAAFDPRCEACNAVFRRVKHKWDCQGLKAHLPQNC